MKTLTVDGIYVTASDELQPDEIQQYDEVSCVSGAYGLLKLQEFMKEFMKL